MLRDATLSTDRGDTIRGLASDWLAWFGLCLQRRKDRRALLDLSGDALRDIGISRADVARETERWPWDGNVR